MTAISSLTDEEVDELLAGHAPFGHGELAPLAEVATALRERTADEPVPAMRYPLRHAVIRSATPVAPIRSRRLVHTALGGAALTVLGLAGAANALPAPMQDAVAEVGDLVGVEVPHADDGAPLELPAGVGDPARSAVSGGEGTDLDGDAPPDTTPGGATPAEPGTPGDLDPATPAVPPEPEVESDEHGQAPNLNASEGAENGSPDASEGSQGSDDAQEPAEDADGDDGDGDEDEHAQETIDGRVDRHLPPTAAGAAFKEP